MKFIADLMNGLAGFSGTLPSIAWKSLVILALVFAGMALWRRSTAAIRHLVWTATFFCLLCLPVFMFCLPAWRAPVWMTSASLNNRLPDSLKFVFGGFAPQKPAMTGPVSESRPAPLVRQTTLSTRPDQSQPISGSVAVMVIWFAGMTMCMTRILAARIQLRRMTRRAQICGSAEPLKILKNLRLDYRIKRPVQLLIVPAPATPMAWGWRQPIIALPAEALEWPEERLRMVLRHELAHVQRWDCLTQEIAQVACAFYWFNPLTWLAAHRMRGEREKACDDLVLNTGERAVTYANHLVAIARQFSAPAQFGGAVAMARPSGLEQRVVAILDGRRNRNTMGTITAAFIVLAIFGLGFLMGGCSNKKSSEKWSLKHSAVSAQLTAFVAEKKSQEITLLEADKLSYARDTNEYKLPDCQPFFAAAAKGDWLTVSNLWSELEKGAWHPTGTNRYPHGQWLQPVKETFGAIEAFAAGSEKYSRFFGQNIIQSIPSGSMYFGGTDPGRFVISALQKSHADGDPFFTLTQNALADGSYLDYLRSMFAGKIYLPTGEDLQKSFENYEASARIRFQNHQLKPGENFKVSEGRIEISGATAVMEINGLLFKIIFDQNTNRDFFIEESYPIDWMYPHLEPHGLIFKINRQPLSKLPDDAVSQDHDYWTQTIQPMIGDWLHDDTPVKTIAAFAGKVFLRHDFSGFSGDPDFVRNHYWSATFSKERASLAGLYVWRMNHAASTDEKERMAGAADLAFRQALALCPSYSKTSQNYRDFLKSRNRDADAALVSEMMKQFPPEKEN
jgi:beta-lactamase regulating signal transducer with metallopeptidase domain